MPIEPKGGLYCHLGAESRNILLPYSVVAVYVLNLWDVDLRGQYSFRSLVLAELLLIGFGLFGAHVGFTAAGEAKSVIWAAISGAVFGVIFALVLPLYTPFSSLLGDCLWGLGALVLGAVLSVITTLVKW
jgi:hypothetical protein